METLQRIAWFCMSQGKEYLPDVDVDETFRERPAYQEGRLTDQPDLSIYDEGPGEDEAHEEDDTTRQNESEDEHG